MARILVYLLIASLPLSVCPTVARLAVAAEARLVSGSEQPTETREETEPEAEAGLPGRRRLVMVKHFPVAVFDVPATHRAWRVGQAMRRQNAVDAGRGHCRANALRAPLRT